ncbi:MAG: flagellar hook-associated protein FlgL [Burkholderiales bacterium]
MRISTANGYSTAIDSLMDRQTSLTDTQLQMTSGKRVNKASDDPAAAARSERAQATQARTAATQRAVDASNNAMTLTEGALGDAGDLMQQVREALVSAGNATYGDIERAGVADTLAGLRQQLLAVANRTDGSGNYLFGGQSSSQAPFTDMPGGVQFQGSPGASQSASGNALPLSLDGDSAWMSARTGNGVFATSATTSTGSAWIDAGKVTNPGALTGSTYSVQFSVAAGATTYSVLKDGVPTAQSNVAFTPGQSVQVDGMSAAISGRPANGDAFQFAPSTANLSVFDALDQAISALKTPNRSSAQIQQGNAVSLASVDSVMGQLNSARSAVGATMNRVSAVTDRLSALTLSSKTEQSNAEDLDMTQAISDFSNKQTGYDAALKAYSMVQRLSLFNYLSS